MCDTDISNNVPEGVVCCWRVIFPDSRAQLKQLLEICVQVLESSNEGNTNSQEEGRLFVKGFFPEDYEPPRREACIFFGYHRTFARFSVFTDRGVYRHPKNVSEKSEKRRLQMKKSLERFQNYINYKYKSLNLPLEILKIIEKYQ
jgi:hypothetical protein